MMNTKKTSQILPALFAVICAAFAGYFILIGSGMFTEPSVALILLATITILLLNRYIRNEGISIANPSE